jgi:PhnB protein
MVSRLNPYISFRSGRAREAMEFYRSVFGGELEISTFAEMGQTGPEAELVMHGHLRTPQGYSLMGADSPPGAEPPSTESYLTITVSGDEPELRDFWAKLSDGGQVLLPFEKQMWGDEYGDCIDRFGVRWAIDLGEPGSAR